MDLLLLAMVVRSFRQPSLAIPTAKRLVCQTARVLLRHFLLPLPATALAIPLVVGLVPNTTLLLLLALTLRTLRPPPPAAALRFPAVASRNVRAAVEILVASCSRNSKQLIGVVRILSVQRVGETVESMLLNCCYCSIIDQP